MAVSLSSPPMSLLDMPGGEPPEFAGTYDYKCGVCNQILLDPMQTICGHRLCKKCVEDHLREKDPSMCPYGEKDCMEVSLKDNKKSVFPDYVLLKELKKIKVYCPYKANGCTEEVAWGKLSQHEQACEYGQDHMDSECPTVMINCSNGCGVKFHRKKLDVHISNACPNRPESLQAKIKELEDTTGRHDKLIKGTQVVTAENADSLEEHAELLAKHTRDVETIKKNSENPQEQSHSSSLLPQRVTELERRYTEQKADLKHFQEQLTAKLSQIDLRFQVLETASFDGTLLWKIRDYRRRKVDARDGGIMSLYSQAFYTSRHGYRMCARVYLNGDGMGEGTHMSLFFVIMRGDYDALLKWPFRQRVSLMLLHQSSQGTRNMVDTFKPDPSSSSFQRPVTDMNVASGCPLFVSHAALEVEDSVYRRDDTIFIKIIVDVTDL